MIEADTEEVDATGDVEVDAPRPDALRVRSSGSRGGKQESVAVVKC